MARFQQRPGLWRLFPMQHQPRPRGMGMVLAVMQQLAGAAAARLFQRIVLLLLLLCTAVSARSGELAPLLDPPLVETIRLEGLRHTSESAVLDLVSVRSGELLDPTAVWESRRRLLEQGWFERVDLRLVRGRQPGAVVLVIALQESVAFGFSADLSNFTEGVLSLGLEYRWKPMTFSARAFLGEEVPGFALGFDAAAFLHPRVGLSARVYRRGREGIFESFLELPTGLDPEDLQTLAKESGLSFSRVGASVELSYAFGKRRATALTLGQRIEGLSGDNINGKTALGGETQLLSALAVGIVYASLDTPLFPTRGSRARVRLQLSDGMLGSDYGFTRLSVDIEHWLRVSRKLALSPRLRFGLVTGEAPFSEHVFAADLVRGYGTYAAPGGLGARRAVAGGVELAYELRPPRGLRRLRLLGFAELGRLSDVFSELESGGADIASAGIGIEVLTRFGAIALAVPVVVKKLPEVEETFMLTPLQAPWISREW